MVVSNLTITSDAAMGPLEVTVYSGDGEPVDFTLSSGKTSNALSVPPGRATIVGRRPDGGRIRRVVQIGEGETTVNFADSVGPAPDAFMLSETQRGLVSATTDGDGLQRPGESRARLPSTSRLQIGKVVLGALASGLIAPGTKGAGLDGSLGGATIDDLLRGDWDLRGASSRRRGYRLMGWRFQCGRWEPTDWPGALTCTARSPDFLQIGLETGGLGPACVGLMDEAGLGPMVMLPAFQGGLQITFLAKGLLAPGADRSATPGGQRAPVALVSLRNTGAGDLLSALGATGTPSAQALWDQALPRLAPEVAPDLPLDYLADKFERPAEALLAAHYLLRFLPERLPVRWADNLMHALPEAADGPVIAAWARLLNPRAEKEPDVDAAVAERLQTALERPVTLFARTRSLLMQGLHLISGAISDEAYRRAEAYYRPGTDAGGLESFWGAGPDRPGKAEPSRAGAILGRIDFDQGTFLAD